MALTSGAKPNSFFCSRIRAISEWPTAPRRTPLLVSAICSSRRTSYLSAGDMIPEKVRHAFLEGMGSPRNCSHHCLACLSCCAVRSGASALFSGGLVGERSAAGLQRSMRLRSDCLGSSLACRANLACGKAHWIRKYFRHGPNLSLRERALLPGLSAVSSPTCRHYSV